MEDVIVRRFEEKDVDQLVEMIKLAVRTPILDRIYDETAIEFLLDAYSRENLLECEKKDIFMLRF